MKKLFTFLLLSFIGITTQLYGQVANNFNIITMKWRFDAPTEQYLASNGYITLAKTLSHPYIFGDGDPNYANMTLVKGYLDKFFPDVNTSQYFMINWEKGPYVTMRTYPVTDSRFIAAEAEIIRLITEIKKLRPNLKVSIYNMPYRMWFTSKQLQGWNGGVGEGEKFNKVLAKVDFIAPSLYTIFPDEEVGHERNVQYLKDNLDLALYYGKKLNKPVIPYVWHRVAWGTSEYQKQIIQKSVFAETIRFIATYSYNNYKPYAIYWYDGSGQFENYSGINNHLNGSVYDKETYFAMIRDYAKYVKSVLNTALGTTATTTQKVVSYTLINADTEQDIQTIAAGATLNLATLPTKNLNIRANTDPVSVGSVKLVLSGEVSKTVKEGQAPYALFGGTTTTYNAWVPTVGSYTLTGTPYTSSDWGGTAGASLAVSFKVINQTTTTTTSQKVVSYTLINADTDKDIQTISNGATLNLANLPTKNLNIRVNTYPATVGSVKMVLSGKLNKTVTEGKAPYALFGGTGTNYNGWVPALGSYTLMGTPYTAASGGGTAGTTLTVNFTVTQSTAARFATTDAESPLASTTAIYPNPATTRLNIQLSEAGEGQSKITLNDLTGRVVLTKQVSNNEQSLSTYVDVQQLAKGVYILLVDTPKGRTSKRIVVQ